MYREPVTFQEAEAQLNERMDTPTAMKYTDILLAWDAEARQHAFFSARVAEASILAELHSRVQAVVEGRMTADQARRLIRNYFAGEGADALARLGFAPPRDAHGVAELASIARINLILETNVRFAQETAHYRRWETLRKAYPYGIWRCGVCDEHRPEHLARDGRAYAFEHPIWTQSPPGGEFNCHCTRELCSEKDLERLGLKPEPLGSDFEPSSLGFDPSRGLQPPPPSAKTPPEIAEAAEKAVDRDSQTPNSPANPDSIPNLKPGSLPETPALPPVVRTPPVPGRTDTPPAAPSPEPASPEPATVSAPSAPSGVPAEPPGRVSLAALLREKLAKFKEKLAGLWRGKPVKNIGFSPSSMKSQKGTAGTSGYYGHMQDSQSDEQRIKDLMDTATSHNEIPRFNGDIPDYPRKTLADNPHKIHDGISDCTDDEKAKQYEQCKEDIEKLNPGLWQKAQEVYESMDDVEKDVIHGYTMRDLYGINTKILYFYLALVNMLPKKLSDFLGINDFYETERRQRVLEKLPKFTGTVYRGMNFKNDKSKNDFINKLEDGKSPLTGFISTTYQEDKAGLYLKKEQEKVILVIHDTKNGSYLGHLSSTPMDEEVLFSCNQKFRMMNEQDLGFPPKYEKNGITYIHIQET